MRQASFNDLGLQGIAGNFERATPAQIAEVESNLKIELPADYRDFLKEYGASLFAEDVAFTSIEPSPWAVGGAECFDVFYGISSQSGFDLCEINARLKGDIPCETIAIGHDSGSNLILLSLRDQRVMFLDKETGKTYLIAHSFRQFLNSFQRR